MSDKDFDLVVLGAGPAGETVAGRAADHGLRVAIVERELVGGECSYWGCVPSKTLIRPGDVIAAARRVPGAAEAVTGDIDAGAAFAQRDYMTSGWDDSGQIPWLTDKRITLVRGAGRLSGPRKVSITTAEGTATVLTAAQVVLATGTVPAMPPIPGLADIGAWTNRDITAAKQVPPHLLVLGGGAIGVEMAQAFRRLGSESVTIVEAADRLLVREEPFAGLEVAAALQAEGVTVVTGSAVTSVARTRPDGRVVATLANSTTVEADEVLVATGRRPNTANLGLESIGLKPGTFVDVDDRMRATGVDGGWLFAVGDVNGRALLTHMGKYQARIAGDVVAGRDAEDRASRSVVPRVTFTDPQVSAVGLTESEARDVYRNVRAVQCGTGDVAGAYTLGNGVSGTCQLVVDADRRVVVGATFTGPGTAELLHAATIAIAGAVTLDDLWHAVPSFPTLSEVWLRLLEAYGL
jgi:pyruvate/2-oxoglutarate dehydrogenase complex dihydrolipoamide dehydrogenase (E3) component